MTNDKVMIAKYERLSKEDDEDKDEKEDSRESESIKNQDSAIDNYIEKYGNDSWEVYDTYADDGYTGLNFDRPNFQRLKQDIIDGKIDLIICTKQSRIGRDNAGVDNFLFGFLAEHQVRCVGILDGLDNSNRSNKKSAQITGLTNEWYSEDISFSVRSSFDVKRRKGEFIGSIAPYGYLKDPNNKNKLVVDKEVSPIIEKIFKLYLEGYGYVKIAKILNEEKIQSPSEYKQIFNYSKSRIKVSGWSYHTIRRILMSEAYIGNMVQKKTKVTNFKTGKVAKTHKSEIIKVENTHEPIISKSTFELVQKMIQRKSKSRPHVGKKHLFSGIVYCGDCGRKMGYRNDQKTFICMSYRSYGDDICTKHFFKLSELEDIVMNNIKKMIMEYGNEKILKKVYDGSSKATNKIDYINAEINKMETRLKKVNAFKKGLYEEYKSGVITKSEYLDLKNEYANEEDTLTNGIIDKKNIKFKAEELLNTKKEFEELLQKYVNIDELTIEIVNTFIDEINVYEKNEQLTFQIKHKASIPVPM